MKFRNGFVSNSSSSSFICSTNLSREEVENQMEKFKTFYFENFGDKEHVGQFTYFVKNYISLKEVDKNYKGWVEHYPQIETVLKENIRKFGNCIVIDSEDDNSIPYEVFELIESKFNAYRLHLG